MKIQMTREQKQMVRRLRAKGCSYRQIERDLGAGCVSGRLRMLGEVRSPGHVLAQEPIGVLVGASLPG